MIFLKKPRKSFEKKSVLIVRKYLIRRYHSRYPPLVRFFLEKKGGGYLEQKFFIRDFLTKKFSGASRRRKIRGGIWKGGVSGVIPSDLSIFFKRIIFLGPTLNPMIFTKNISTFSADEKFKKSYKESGREGDVALKKRNYQSN